MKNLKWTVTKILLTDGIPCNTSGYWYLLEAVQRLYKSGHKGAPLMKAIYLDIAKEFGVSWNSVERVMRYSISVANIDMNNGNYIMYSLIRVEKELEEIS